MTWDLTWTKKGQCDNFCVYQNAPIHTLQSRGYLAGKRRQNGDEQRPARGIAALQISNTTINYLDHMSQNVKIKRIKKNLKTHPVKNGG